MCLHPRIIFRMNALRAGPWKLVRLKDLSTTQYGLDIGGAI